MKKTVRTNQTGQGLIEYVALTALIAIVSIGAVKTFGGKVQKRLNQITTSFDHNIQQGFKHRTSKAADDDDGEEATPPSGVRIPRGVRLPGGIHLPIPFPSGIPDLDE